MKTVTFFILLVLLLLSACSDDNQEHASAVPQAEQDDGTHHPWETQTDFMDKARAVDGVLQDSARQRQSEIDESTE
ncbi:MAG: hypothetical protein J4A00_03855 [Gammaproteobacteria bacterium]|nr:hypothetical protein [Gammaproteobacteria bacterium]